MGLYLFLSPQSGGDRLGQENNSFLKMTLLEAVSSLLQRGWRAGSLRSGRLGQKPQAPYRGEHRQHYSPAEGLRPKLVFSVHESISRVPLLTPNL